MADQLSLYNGALRILKNRHLDSLTEDVEERYLLDLEYNKAIRYCLEQGLWNFALRATLLEPDDTNEPTWGDLYVFQKPEDYVRLNAIASDQYFSVTLGEYTDEGDYWVASINPLYVSYVSDDPAYGYNLGRWPATFELAVEYELAHRSAPHLTAMSDQDLVRLREEKIEAIRDARSKDALNQPAMRPPPGRLVRARQGSRYSAQDGRPWWR
jgi:hypothetical protein